MKVIIAVENKDFDIVENLLSNKLEEEDKLVKIPSKEYINKIHEAITNKSLKVEFKLDELVIDYKQYFFFPENDITIEVIDIRNPKAIVSLDDAHFAIFYKNSTESIKNLLDENLTKKNYSQILKLDYKIIKNEEDLKTKIRKIIKKGIKITKNPRKHTTNILNIKNIIKNRSNNYKIFLGNVRNGEFKEGDIVYLYEKDGKPYKATINTLKIGNEHKEKVTEGSFCGLTLSNFKFDLEKMNFEFMSTDDDLDFVEEIELTEALSSEFNNKRVKIFFSQGERHGKYKDGMIELFNPICKEYIDTIFDISIIDDLRIISEVKHEFYKTK